MPLRRASVSSLHPRAASSSSSALRFTAARDPARPSPAVARVATGPRSVSRGHARRARPRPRMDPRLGAAGGRWSRSADPRGAPARPTRCPAWRGAATADRRRFGRRAGALASATSSPWREPVSSRRHGQEEAHTFDRKVAAGTAPRTRGPDQNVSCSRRSSATGPSAVHVGLSAGRWNATVARV